jgi:tetratricopeptide (TPR) repeat protein
MKNLFLFVVLFSNIIFSQSNDKNLNDAIKMYVDGDFEEALIVFKDLKNSKNHDLNKALYFEGQTLFELERNEEALKVFDRNISLFPNSFISYKGKAQYYFYLENYKEAIVYFTKAIEIDDKIHSVLYERGECYYNLSDYNLAINDYSSAIELNKNKANYYLSRSICYHIIEEYDRSCEDYKKALELDSSISDRIEFDDCE